MSISDKLITIAENEQKVYEAGKQKTYNAFWDEFQEYGRRNQYVYGFAYNSWDDEVYKPKYPIIAKAYGLRHTYINAGITDTIMPIEAYTELTASFSGCINLITIRKLVLHNVTTITNPFVGCTNLKDIVIEGEWLKNISFSVCPLTTKSIVSIIEHLSDTTTEQTLTLKQSAVDAMTFPFTSEQSGITYNSWDELIATKSNWTITLM